MAENAPYHSPSIIPIHYLDSLKVYTRIVDDNNSKVYTEKKKRFLKLL